MSLEKVVTYPLHRQAASKHSTLDFEYLPETHYTCNCKGKINLMHFRNSVLLCVKTNNRYGKQLGILWPESPCRLLQKLCLYGKLIYNPIFY
jgi:hypothetical protein